MRRIIGVFVALSVFVFTSPAFGFQWKPDLDHAEIRFEVNHILTTVTGTFGKFESDVEFDPEKPEKAKFYFTVDVSSVNTKNGKRDNHLRSKDFFDVDKYPEMSFKSSKVTSKGGNMYQVEGTMTIKNVSKKMAVDFEFKGPVMHPFNKKKVGGFVSKFTIPRLEYGVGNGKFLKMGVVGEMVNVVLEGEAFAD